MFVKRDNTTIANTRKNSLLNCFLSEIGAKVQLIKKEPFQNPPPYEKLVGNLSGSYSRRINIQHRIVYEARESDRVIRVSRMWSHYGE